MAEAAVKKEKVVRPVIMSDGRTVEFPGTRRVLKETVVDESKVKQDGDMLILQAGAVGIRMDFITGDTRLYYPPLSLYPRFLGHGGEQKYGDELAAPSSKPLADADLVIACDDLHEHIVTGEWSQRRESDGFAGASIVIRAFMEAASEKGTPTTAEKVKAFLNGKLEAAKLRGEKLSRSDLYKSFRNIDTKVGKIIARLEQEEAAKGAKVDADAALAEFEAQAA